MKKRDLVDQIKKIKGKVSVGSHIQYLCHQIEKLTERLNDFMATNKKIASTLSTIKSANSSLEKHITSLEKL